MSLLSIKRWKMWPFCGLRKDALPFSDWVAFNTVTWRAFPYFFLFVVFEFTEQTKTRSIKMPREEKRSKECQNGSDRIRINIFKMNDPVSDLRSHVEFPLGRFSDVKDGNYIKDEVKTPSNYPQFSFQNDDHFPQFPSLRTFPPRRY